MQLSTLAPLCAVLSTLGHAELMPLSSRQFCDNSATSRQCWGEYSIDTDYYVDYPETGVTREVWNGFNIEQYQ